MSLLGVKIDFIIGTAKCGGREKFNYSLLVLSFWTKSVSLFSSIFAKHEVITELWKT